MNKELALKLKDAGFPYPVEFEDIDGKFLFEGEENVSIYFPSLSKLIEACGIQFKTLAHDHVLSDWVAVGFINNDFKKVIFSEGNKSPEEAVANLWLDLNKK